MTNFTVIRDQQEKSNYWDFNKGFLSNTVEAHLKTGDYTLDGLENIICIERKGKVGEFAQNIYQKRFPKCLERMKDIKYSCVILEFDMFDIQTYPESAGLPWKIRKKIRVKPHDIIRRMTEFQVLYGTNFILAGSYGREYARRFMKSALEMEGIL